ncbi:hypothetical protein K438DRAFT_1590153 [Mycena galopus ATCC 62051]|nr:hypothetical protein K438DRAFT_1590153 [Mycena galopus ATCC 62051]
MGFGEPHFNEPVVSEGPAALKIKVKKKRYENSVRGLFLLGEHIKKGVQDHPIKTWIPCRDDYCDAFLKLKGRGPWWSEGCAICKETNPTWRCEDCFGNRLLCQACIVEKHWDEPLHHQEWEGGYFHSRTTQDLGLRYQVGHPFSADCPFNYLGGPSKSFVVLHNNGIHSINVDFCCCPQAPSEVTQLLNVGWYPATQKDPSTAATLSLLRRFHKLNLQARLPAYDFYNTLVLLTNASGLKTVPHRLQQFMNMVREYRHLQMCKRAGRGHDPAGISATPAGELAISCRACPQPGINLPEGWNTAPPEVA